MRTAGSAFHKPNIPLDDWPQQTDHSTLLVEACRNTGFLGEQKSCCELLAPFSPTWLISIHSSLSTAYTI